MLKPGGNSFKFKLMFVQPNKCVISRTADMILSDVHRECKGSQSEDDPDRRGVQVGARLRTDNTWAPRTGHPHSQTEERLGESPLLSRHKGLCQGSRSTGEPKPQAVFTLRPSCMNGLISYSVVDFEQFVEF